MTQQFLPKTRDGALLDITDILYKRLNLVQDHMAMLDHNKSSGQYIAKAAEAHFLRNLLDLIERS